MALTIGPKRLLTLLEQGTDLYALPMQRQFEAFRTMAHVMTKAPAGMPRRLPKWSRPLCGATCRTGWPCRRRVVWDESNDRPRNKRRPRCPNHGGYSTGPRTPEGRQRISASNRRRAQARRQAAAQAGALAAYRQAVAKYEALRQHPMEGFPGLKDAMLQNQAYQIDLAAQRCLACGVVVCPITFRFSD
jgi:hypothetical protein